MFRMGVETFEAYFTFEKAIFADWMGLIRKGGAQP
jgi:hypothetical protein